MKMDNHLLVLFFLCGLIGCAFACNGYSLKLNSAKNCNADSVIKLENPGASLDKDCNLILLGCLNFPKGFKTAKGKYVLKKAPMPPMDGEIDFCEAIESLDDPQLGSVAKLYNMPTKCPLKGGKTCGASDKKISLARFKNQMGIASGTIDLHLEATHDTGTTCIDINLTISRNRARG